MTDTNMLREYIDKSGYKMSFILEKLNISRQGFLNKINNKGYFRQNEIYILSELLGLNSEAIEKIFFNENVDKTSTSEEV